MSKSKSKTTTVSSLPAVVPGRGRTVKPANRTVLIRKSNDLVEGRYKFDIWETRIFLKMLTLIKADDRGFYEYKIYIKDIIETFGVDSKDSYRLIKEGARKLMGKIIETKIKVEDGWEDFVAPIVAGFKGKTEEKELSYIKLSFHPDMRPLLLELRERYLVYDFQNVRNLSSPYYIRIYELLKQYEKIGERRFAVDELREILGLKDEYKLYGHFKSRIIDPSQARLAEFTDIQFTYSEIKQGRAVAFIIFHIRANRPTARPVVESRRATAAARHQPHFFETSPTFAGEQDLGYSVENQQVYDTFFTRLNDWWGVQEEVFKKRLDHKTAADVERAIEFTKDRIRTGKAHNPAGVFLDALEKGHRTHQQHRADRRAEAARREQEIRQRLQPLVERYDELLTEKTAAINEMVRAILTVHPELTETVIEEIKNTYRLTGEKTLEHHTVEDFRRDPMLRSMVIAGIIRRFPARFEELSEQFAEQIEALRSEILAVKPGFVFE